jgi:hypothetical protein
VQILLLVDLTEQALDEGPNYQIQRTNKPNLLAVPHSQTVGAAHGRPLPLLEVSMEEDFRLVRHNAAGTASQFKSWWTSMMQTEPHDREDRVRKIIYMIWNIWKKTLSSGL